HLLAHPLAAVDAPAKVGFHPFAWAFWPPLHTAMIAAGETAPPSQPAQSLLLREPLESVGSNCRTSGRGQCSTHRPPPRITPNKEAIIRDHIISAQPARAALRQAPPRLGSMGRRQRPALRPPPPDQPAHGGARRDGGRAGRQGPRLRGRPRRCAM